MLRHKTLMQVVLVAGLFISAVQSQASSNEVFRAGWTNSLNSTSTNLQFSRASEATYFNSASQRIVTVSANAPRFVTAPDGGKLWGAGAGLLLEGLTTNLLTDSSFEAFGSEWQVIAGQATQTTNGVHGQHGLRVTGPATIQHSAVQVQIYPASRLVYWLSLYVRRVDGGVIAPGAVQCVGRPQSGPWDASQVVQSEPVRLGSGPWYRISASVGYYDQQCNLPPETNRFNHSFVFDGNEYYVDAAQLEHAGGNVNCTLLYGAPTTYVPTTNQAAARLADILSAPVQDVLRGDAWSYSFWTRTDFANWPAFPGNRLFGVWGDAYCWGQAFHTFRDHQVAPPSSGCGADAPATGWAHIAVTYSDGLMDFFIDGVSDHSQSGPFPVTLPAPLSGTAYWSRSLLPSWGGEMLSACGLTADFTTWDRALTPEEVEGLYVTGVPCVLPPDPNDIRVNFTLAQAGKVSVNLFHSDGRLARQLLIGKDMVAGSNTVYWNKCDDTGLPLPTGLYTLKGLRSTVHSIWDAKIGNTSPDEGGEWLQYRTGYYYDVAPIPGGGVVTLSNWGEHGNVIQGLSGSAGYPVVWNANAPGLGLAAAADGTYVYVVSAHMLSGGQVRESITRYTLSNGAAAPYGSDVWVTPVRSGPAPWTCNPRTPYSGAGVCGLAVHGGNLYAPRILDDIISVFDASSGQLLQNYACADPLKVAVNSAGSYLYATSGRNLRRIALDQNGLLTGSWSTLATNLVDGCAIAIDPDDGNIYLTDLGASQQVKVYNPGGQLLGTYGEEGGHTGGTVASDLLESPIGLVFGTDGTLFIADLGGQRVLALNPDFTVKKTIHGRMPFIVSVDEDDPSHTYVEMPGENLFEYTVDYATGSNALTRRWHTFENTAQAGGWPVPLNYSWNPSEFRMWGGRKFVIWGGLMNVAELNGDNLIPRVVLGYGNSRLPPTIVWNASWTPEQIADKGWIWRDQYTDGHGPDGIIQASEFEFEPQSGAWPIARTLNSWLQSSFIDQQGNIFYTPSQVASGLSKGVVKFVYGGLDAYGFPIYRWNTAGYVLTVPDEVAYRGKNGVMYPVSPNAIAVDSQGYLYLSDHGDMGTYQNVLPLGLMKIDPNGTLLWRVGRNQPGYVWHPGDLKGCAPLADFLDQQYLFLNNSDGAVNVWDTNGLWVARLFADLPADLFLPGETLSSHVFRHSNGNVYALSAPDCIYRVARIIVDGLADIERFESQILVTNPPTVTWSYALTNGPSPDPTYSTDLVNVGQATLSSVSSSGTVTYFGGSLGEVNDGVYGNFNSMALNPVDGATVTFTLNTVTNSHGYDIGQVVSYAGYCDGRRAYQNYDVAVHTVGMASGTFITVVSTGNLGYYTGAAEWTQVSIGDGSTVIASGVDQIRFTFKRAGRDFNGVTIYHEIDVFGYPVR